LQIPFAERHRFRSRLVYKVIPYPPPILGDGDFVSNASKEENEVIRRIVQVRAHPEAPLFPDEYSLNGPPKGRVYQKIPFKFKVEKGKVYSYCTCGYANNQVINQFKINFNIFFNELN
jgi:hypothetical protein